MCEASDRHRGTQTGLTSSDAANENARIPEKRRRKYKKINAALSIKKNALREQATSQERWK